jgi:hypothetical protein
MSAQMQGLSPLLHKERLVVDFHQVILLMCCC